MIFKVNLLSFVVRIRKIELDLVKSQKLIPAKSSEYQNGKILYSQNSNNKVFGVLLLDSVRFRKSFAKLFGVWPQNFLTFQILTALVCTTKFWPSQNVKTIANCQQLTITLLEMSERSQTYRCKVYSQILETPTCLIVLLLYLVTSLSQQQVRHIH